MIPLNLLLHINFNHLSLSPKERVAFLDSYLEEILDSIKVNLNISICAEDLLLLSIWNRKCFNKLISHPKLCFLLTPFSHSLPNLFPANYIENVKLGSLIISTLIPEVKIIKIGYSPEVDLPATSILKELVKYWDALVLGETRIKIKGLCKDMYPPRFSIFMNSTSEKIDGILSRRNFNFRDYFHQYLRGEILVGKLCEGIITDYQKFSSPFPILLRIDLETLLFNRPIRKDGRKGVIPMKRFRAFQDRLTKEKFSVRYINPSSFNLRNSRIPVFSTKEISPSREENYKWENRCLQRKVEKFLARQKTLHEKIQTFSLCCSDYYCTSMRDFEFKLKGDWKIKISKRRTFRNLESEAKIGLIKTQDPEKVLSRISDKSIVKYLKYYIQLVNRTVSLTYQSLEKENSQNKVAKNDNCFLTEQLINQGVLVR